MVLCQFIIDTNNNATDFIVPISGKCSIRVLGIQYHDTAGNGTSRIIQIQSDVLFFPYSPARYLTLMTSNNGNVNIDQGHKEYNLYATIPGKINLNVVNRATGAQPANFQHCILTLELEQLNRDFDIEA
jgi:hypothetical protein